MSTIYRGSGWGKTAIGEYDNGTIYSGTVWNKTAIGEYDNGTIYSGTSWEKIAIGEYDNGTIYSGTGWSKTAIGEYDNGTIYSGTGWNKTAIGEYNGSEAGAAAYLLLDALGSSGGSSSGGSKSNADTGCLGSIFSLLLGVISFIFVTIIPFLFVYLLIPEILGYTWIGYLSFLLGGLCTSIGLLPLAIFFAIIPYMIIQPLFYIYWVLVIVIKIKTHCTKSVMLKLFWKWFLKGPVAFLELASIMEANNIIPKVAKLLNSVIEFFKRIFAKK